MRATKPFSKTKKPQTVVDTIVGHANIVLDKLVETDNRHSVVLWLDNFDHIELFQCDSNVHVRYFKRNVPASANYALQPVKFAEHIIFNPKAHEKLVSLANDILCGHNTMIAPIVP